MKSLLIVILLVGTSTIANDDIPSLAATHIDILNRHGSKLGEVEEWPDRFAKLRKRTKKQVNSTEDHLAVVEAIPDSFLNGVTIGQTIETYQWILTSLDPGNTNSEDSVWILVIASKKGENWIYANSVW